MIQEITDHTFTQETAEGLCLVLFYKDPCPYCKTMKGVVEKFSSKNPTIRVLQINGPENPKAAEELSVDTFPVIVFYKDGRLTTARQKGLTNPQGLTELYKTI